MGTDLPLVARQAELLAVAQVLDSAMEGRGRGILVTGEAGIGKTRLLRQARADARRRGMVVLSGRAVESGGAFRPIVEAFARPAAPFADHPDLDGVRPALARVLPGWVCPTAVRAPMADPAAVLAEALIILLQAMAPGGAALVLDDLHWADPDTLSVLASLADSVDTLPLALVLASRHDGLLPSGLQQLTAEPAMRVVPLRRLAQTEVEAALHDSCLPVLSADQMDRLVARVDGLPMILDECVRQIRENGVPPDHLDLGRSTLASAVQRRLGGLSADTRVLLDALSVIGDADADVLMAATGLDLAQLGAALRAGLGSTLLVAAPTALGVAWRHALIADTVRDLLLPLERQAIARRAADQLADGDVHSDGQLSQAAQLYALAGYRHLAAQQLIRAARVAITNSALDVAQQHLADAQSLTGQLPRSAREVLIERLTLLTLAGRAGDAYDCGMQALDPIDGSMDRELLVCTARAAYTAGYHEEGRALLERLERDGEPPDAQLAVLRAQAALADRKTVAIDLGEQAAAEAGDEGRVDLVCQALLIVGRAAGRVDTERARRALRSAFEIAKRHDLVVWKVRAHAELSAIAMFADADYSPFDQARETATAAGMVGAVIDIDRWIIQGTVVQLGTVAAYPRVLRALSQARQLRLQTIRVRLFVHLLECVLLADQPVPGSDRPPGPADIEGLIAEADRLGESSDPGASHRCVLGTRAWLHGDNSTAIRLIGEDVQRIEHEIKIIPYHGFRGLLQVAEGVSPLEAFGPVNLTGHHVNWAARALGTAIWNLRTGQPGDAQVAEAERLLRRTPFYRHLLRTVAAPAMQEAGFAAAEGWLREADSYYTGAGEFPLQRRVRRALADIGAKVPRTGASTVQPHLARVGITAREADVLRLVNAGLGNQEIAARLFISVRTVETHISSMLAKTGSTSRDRLPSADQEGITS